MSGRPAMLAMLPLVVVALGVACWAALRVLRRPAAGRGVSAGKWRRFRGNPRAMASLALLGAVYLASLASELLCNSRPLYLRTRGRGRAPFLRYVSQDDAFGEGGPSEVDYATLESDPRFTADPSARVVFAPFRFGPHDVVDPRTLEGGRRYRAVVRRRVRMGRCDVAGDLSSAGRRTGCEPFLGDPPAPVAEVYDVPAAFLAAISNRFANLPSPAANAIVRRKPGAPAGSGDAATAELSLREYEPRPRPPRKLRLRVADPGASARPPVALVLEATPRGLRPVRSSRAAWDGLGQATREALERAAGEEAAGQAGEIVADAGPDTSASLSRETVAWPWRPVPGHWMGVDAAGRDVFARIMYGTRAAMTFGLLLVAWSMLVGVAAGAVQGFFGGAIDLVGQRFTEIWSSLPFLYVMILVGSVFGRSFGLLLFCYGLFNWIGVSYYVRAEFLRLRDRPFVDAARCQGLSPLRIMWRHVLPNALTPVVTLLPFNLVGAIGSISALDFLGFGMPPLTPSWGELLQQAQQNAAAWWLILYPSAILFLVMLLAVFVGEGLRDAFDPKPASRYR